MSNTRLVERTATFFAAVLLAATCRAESLLIEEQHHLVDFSPASGDFGIAIVEARPIGTPNIGSWSAEVSVASTGQTFTLNRQELGDYHFYRFNSVLFNDGGDLIVSLFAPLMAGGSGTGIELPLLSVTDYHLSRMEFTLDAFAVANDPQFNQYRREMDFTFRIYGAPGHVPEPSTLIFAFIALCSLVVHRHGTRLQLPPKV